MSKLYPPIYEEFYKRLSSSTGMSKNECDLFVLKMIQIYKSELNRKGEVVLPYIGKFYLNRMPPRKRSVVDFCSGKRFIIDVPAQDKLKFIINKAFRKLFK